MKSFPEAIALFQAGRFYDAISACRQILTLQPGHVDAWQMIGLSLAQSGRQAEAVEPLETALRLKPDLPALCNNLGELYRQLGRPHDAERLLRRALELQPRFAEAVMSLGNALKDQDRYPEAIEAFQSAVRWKPEYANAHLNLANTLWKEGRVQSAINHYHEYLRRQSARADVLLSLGGAYADVGDQAKALDWFEQAAAVDPENSDIDSAIGHAWMVQGQVSRARSFFQRVAIRKPAALLSQLRAASLCEVIPPSESYIDEYRQQLSETLTRLANESLAVELDELHQSGAEPPMGLAYQGRDDLPIKRQYAALFADKFPKWDLAPRTGQPHIGVVVTNGHEGVYAECLGRLVARLANRRQLKVTVVCSRAGANVIPYLLGTSAVEYLTLADSLPESVDRLEKAQFDLLHYWEVGTDSTNYFLPFFRAAPVQSACWGWPVTTGMPTIDYFVSSRWIEPEHATDHYSEGVVPLETLPTWYARPPVPAPLRSRSSFGWPEQRRIYLCTQNLRKYHPDFDVVLADILRSDPDGFIYAIEDAQHAISLLLHARFAKAYPDVSSRLNLIPRQKRPEYLNLVSLADVVIDTPHYGGGANSLYDAFACGTPIVTLPGRFHRGRYGLAICRKLDLPEMVATSPDDFARRAIEIAMQPELRRSLRLKISERSAELFEDDTAVLQHEQFFLSAIEKSRSSSTRVANP